MMLEEQIRNLSDEHLEALLEDGYMQLDSIDRRQHLLIMLLLVLGDEHKIRELKRIRRDENEMRT